MSNEKSKLLVISGSSGVGKGTVIKSLLLKCNNLNLSISCTTRNPREGEIDGVNYFFITKDDFMQSVKNNEFIVYYQPKFSLKETMGNLVKNKYLLIVMLICGIKLRQPLFGLDQIAVILDDLISDCRLLFPERFHIRLDINLL